MRSAAQIAVDESGHYQVSIEQSTSALGPRAILLWAAAEALGAGHDMIEIRIGDTAVPDAMGAGGSMGTASWSWVVVSACHHYVDGP